MRNYNRQRNPALLRLEASLRSHPIFWCAVGVLTAAAFGGLILSIAKYLMPSGPKPTAEDIEADLSDDQIFLEIDKLLSNSLSTAEGKGVDIARKVKQRIALAKSNITVSDPPIGTRKQTDTSRAIKAIRPRANHTVSDPPLGTRKQTDSTRVIKSLRPGKPNYTKQALVYYDKIKDLLGELTPEEEEKVMGEIQSFDSMVGTVPDEEIFSEFMANVSTGMTPTLAIAATVAALQKEPSDSTTLVKVHSNMLKASDMIHQDRDSSLKVFHTKLNKIYVKVSNCDDLGVCYGIPLAGKYILTVSHLFKQEGDLATVTSNGVCYKAKCIYLVRERDLSVVALTDKSAPQFPNTLSCFHPTDQLSEAPPIT